MQAGSDTQRHGTAPDLVRVRRALLSVSDKAGLEAFARALAGLGVELISTGGTARTLSEAGLSVRAIESLTDFPEMMDGRVKTLHPRVHGGLLAVRTNPEHARAMREHGIEAIDLVCVNLYPFEATIAKGCSRGEAIEQIDIGGPSMLRSAAKNHAFVTVAPVASVYGEILEDLRSHDGHTTLALRERLARLTFARTAAYDGAISTYLNSDAPEEDAASMPKTLSPRGTLRGAMRYGENPHQRGGLYVGEPVPAGQPDVARATQHHGKELSYNNLLDASAAATLAHDLAGLDDRSVAACVIKHTNPCGASLASDAACAIRLAILGDPLAAYGGILAVSGTIDEHAARGIAHKEHFFEVVCAPAFEPEALALLRARWQHVRLLELAGWKPGTKSQGDEIEVRSIAGGLLAQARDATRVAPEGLQHAAGPAPSATQVRTALFLERVGRALLSNAVALGGPAPANEASGCGGGLRLFGAGAGQMDRVASCRLAVQKAGEHAAGAVAYSDAFFPFSDGPRILLDAGVAALVHPGGSKRDAETFELCDQRGATCLLTGTRHFRH